MLVHQRVYSIYIYNLILGVVGVVEYEPFIHLERPGFHGLGVWLGDIKKEETPIYWPCGVCQELFALKAVADERFHPHVSLPVKQHCILIFVTAQTGGWFTSLNTDFRRCLMIPFPIVSLFCFWRRGVLQPRKIGSQLSSELIWIPTVIRAFGFLFHIFHNFKN